MSTLVTREWNDITMSVLASPWIELWTIALLHFLWQATAIVCIYGAMTRWGGILSSRDRYLAGVLALLAIAICPAITVGWLGNQAEPGSAAVWARPSALSAGHEEALTDREGLERPYPLAANASAALNLREDPSTLAFPLGWKVIVFCLWILGVGVCVLRLIFGGLYIWQLRRQAFPLDESWRPRLDRLVSRLKAPRAIEFAISKQATMALVCGLTKPIVLIPAAWLLELTPGMLESVLAHEIAHLTRRDLWVNFLQRILEAIYFFHPGVWWLSCEIRREREKCCDELAVSVLPSRVDYARTLRRVAEVRLAGNASPFFSTGFGGHRMLLLQRIRHILGHEAAQSSRFPWGLGFFVAILVTLFAVTMTSHSATADVAEPSAADAESVADDATANQEESELTDREDVETTDGEADEGDEQDEVSAEMDEDDPEVDGEEEDEEDEEDEEEEEEEEDQEEQVEVDQVEVEDVEVEEVEGIEEVENDEDTGEEAELIAMERAASEAAAHEVETLRQENKLLKRAVKRLERQLAAVHRELEARVAADGQSRLSPEEDDQEIPKKTAGGKLLELTELGSPVRDHELRQKMERDLNTRVRQLQANLDSVRKLGKEKLASERAMLAKRFAAEARAVEMSMRKAQMELERQQLGQKRQVLVHEARVKSLQRQFEKKGDQVSPDERAVLERAIAELEAERAASEADQHLAERIRAVEIESAQAELEARRAAETMNIEREVMSQFEREIHNLEQQLEMYRQKLRQVREEMNSRRQPQRKVAH